MTSPYWTLGLIVVALGAGSTGPALAQLTSRIAFERGNDNAFASDTVTGQGYRDFLLGARAGQSMSVSLMTRGSAYFNIQPPGSDAVAIYNGSIEGSDATVRLPTSGDYTIRVYLMGNDADTGVTVPFDISVAIM